MDMTIKPILNVCTGCSPSTSIDKLDESPPEGVATVTSSN